MSKFRERGVLRSLCAKDAKALDDLIKNNAALQDLNARFGIYTSRYGKLKDLDDQISEEMLSDESRSIEEVEKELEKCDEYTFPYLRMKETVATLNNQAQNELEQLPPHQIVQAPTTPFSQFTVKREIRKFDGELRNWIGFWTQFSKIHENSKIPNEDKFDLLLQHLKVGSAAERLVLGFPPSRENYEKAIDLLKSRFGKDEFLVEFYVREILNLVIKKNQNIAVSEFYDQLESQLRALESLGTTQDKYAAILFPMVESAVPDHVFRIWERHRVDKGASIKDPSQCLAELLSFLKIEVESEERLKMRENCFERESQDSSRLPQKPRKGDPNRQPPTAAALVVGGASEQRCIFCDKGHKNPQDCSTAADLSLEQRSAVIKKKGACFKCLRKGHLSGKCTQFVKCVLCKGRHFPILCNNISVPLDSKEAANKEETVTAMSTSNFKQNTFLQTLQASLISKNEKIRVRILLDGGSQRSYVTKKCAKKLHLRQCGKVEMTQKLFGGKETAPKFYGIYKAKLENLDKSFLDEFTLLGQDCICDFVPQVNNKVLIGKLSDLGVIMTDVEEGDCQWDEHKIDILLGSDSWPKLVTGQYVSVSPDLVAIKTTLGWTLSGAVPNFSTIAQTLLVTLTCQTHLSHFWDLELMGINDPSVKKAEAQKNAEVVQFFEKTVKRGEDGRVIVKLPWVECPPPLENNRIMAEKRLWSTTHKLRKMGRFEDYDRVIQEWLNLGIVEEVEEIGSLVGTHYLPHRAVIKDSASTQVRPVFDASQKDPNNLALNDLLETGPNLIELVPSILTNFRQFKYGLSADIERAFLQIVIDPEDRDFLRFLWWKDGKIIGLRHCRVVFGVSSSPFLLGAVLNYVLRNALPEHKALADKLKKSFYVDNLLSGVDTQEELETFVANSKKLLSSAGFNLRSWVDNVRNSDCVEKILGLKWYCGPDVIGCNASLLDGIPRTTTRRTLFSVSQRMYDPIGFTAPISLLPKVLVQKTWSLNLGWDDPLPPNICGEFEKWTAEITTCLDECRIPRRVIINETTSLHVFCDASKIAYACCVFVRTQLNDGVHVSLILAKTRVAPAGNLTIPRLELMAAVIGVRICNLAKEGLHKSIPTHYWSDSAVVVKWIQGGGVWSVFVHNRVKEILESSDKSQWQHIPGSNNPADLLSRGCSPRQLKTWLRQPRDIWPISATVAEPELVEAERRRCTVTTNVIVREDFSVTRLLAHRWSSYKNIINKCSTLIDFLCWKFSEFSVDFKTNHAGDIHPSKEEKFLNTELALLRAVQREYFTQDVLSTLKNYDLFEDERGILHLRTRLMDDDLSDSFRLPIILPGKHPLITRLIEEEHRQNHAGAGTLMMLLRARFWLLNGRRAISSVLKNCFICQKHRAKPMEVPFPPLPKDRTTISATFQSTGLDLCGPLFLNNGEKVWILIFTCAVYRAVHLELVHSLSSEALIQAIRRFIARRGRPLTFYSDNGTNFVGLENLLSELDWDQIRRECAFQRIKWKFNAPTAAWWGGFWERLIRILKDLLKKNLGNRNVNLQELSTLLCECESVMNGRPLTYVSEDPADFVPLTPSMFLISLTGTQVEDFDRLESQHGLQGRLNYLQKVRQGVRSRFQKEYLGFLRSSHKKRTDTVNIGDVVLIANDKKRLHWPLGKILDIFPGRDGVVRVAKLKTATGELTRPLQRLYPLEIHSGSHEEPDGSAEMDPAENEIVVDSLPVIDLTTSDEEEPEGAPLGSIRPSEEMITRRGRLIKPREKLDL